MATYHVPSSAQRLCREDKLFDPGSKSHACPVDEQQGRAACLVPSSPCYAEVQGRLIRTLAYALKREVLSNESTDRF
jgi:hypothetical protein